MFVIILISLYINGLLIFNVWLKWMVWCNNWCNIYFLFLLVGNVLLEIVNVIVWMWLVIILNVIFCLLFIKYCLFDIFLILFIIGINKFVL